MGFQFFFGHGAVGLVVDDGETVLFFYEAVHDALQEEGLALFALRVEGMGGKEDGEWHFLPQSGGSLHQSGEGAFGEGEEGFDGIAISPMGEEDFRLFFGEDVLIRKGADVFSEGVFGGRKGGEVDHLHRLVHEGAEGGAAIQGSVLVQEGGGLAVVGGKALCLCCVIKAFCEDGGSVGRFISLGVFCFFAELDGGGGGEFGRGRCRAGEGVAPCELPREPVRDGFRKMGEEGLSIEGGRFVLFFFRCFRFLTFFEEGFLAFCEQVFLGDDAEIKVGVVARSIALEGGDFLEAVPDRGEVSVVERGREDPVQIGAGMGNEVRGKRARRITSAAGERGRTGSEDFPCVRDGGGEVESIAGAGHGDVEEACFFGAVFTLGGSADGVPVEGGPAQASFAVKVLDTEAESFVAEGDAGHIRSIEVFRKVGENDDGEFQSFAAVDGHDTDGIGGGGIGLCLETTVDFKKAR